MDRDVLVSNSARNVAAIQQRTEVGRRDLTTLRPAELGRLRLCAAIRAI
jgi:hypothetical protein